MQVSSCKLPTLDSKASTLNLLCRWGFHNYFPETTTNAKSKLHSIQAPVYWGMKEYTLGTAGYTDYIGAARGIPTLILFRTIRT